MLQVYTIVLKRRVGKTESARRYVCNDRQGGLDWAIQCASASPQSKREKVLFRIQVRVDARTQAEGLRPVKQKGVRVQRRRRFSYDL
jgi:hypothetical protein